MIEIHGGCYQETNIFLLRSSLYSTTSSRHLSLSHSDVNISQETGDSIKPVDIFLISCKHH